MERKTKDELLAEMYEHLEHQKEFANQKYKEAIAIEESADINGGSRRTKKENTDLKEYNAQVDAIGRTISTIIRIQKSNLDNGEEEITDDSEDELV